MQRGGILYYRQSYSPPHLLNMIELWRRWLNIYRDHCLSKHVNFKDNMDYVVHYFKLRTSQWKLGFKRTLHQLPRWKPRGAENTWYLLGHNLICLVYTSPHFPFPSDCGSRHITVMLTFSNWNNNSDRCHRLWKLYMSCPHQTEIIIVLSSSTWNVR